MKPFKGIIHNWRRAVATKQQMDYFKKTSSDLYNLGFCIEGYLGTRIIRTSLAVSMEFNVNGNFTLETLNSIYVLKGNQYISEREHPGDEKTPTNT